MEKRGERPGLLSWSKVSIVHDAHLIHDVSREGWHAAGMGAIVPAIDKDATRLFNEHFAELFAAPPKQKKGGGRRKPRGRLLGKRRKAKDVR